MIDAPVSGGSRGAVAGTIAIICGGPPDAFERIRPVLADISPNIVYCGGVGNGHAAKLVQNAVAACNRVITLECVAAACKNGLSTRGMSRPAGTASRRRSISSAGQCTGPTGQST
jgi:3-hydroxyisobutyrate dehydrogenase